MAEYHASAGTKIKIRHQTWNALMDLVSERKGTTQSGGGLADSATTGLVEIYNDTGTAFDANQVVGLDAPLFAESDNSSAFRLRPAFRAVDADGDHHKGMWAVCAEPIRDKAIGRAWVTGVAAVSVDITDDTHRFCELTGSSSATTLESATGGRAMIITKGSGTAPYTTWCLVLLSGGTKQAMRCNCLVKMTGGLAGEASFTVDNVVATDGGISPLTDPTDTAEELTVDNSMFVWSADDNAPCKIEWNAAALSGAGQWEAYQVKCPA